MNNVGIVTLIDFANFGNRLQNFALQQAIRNLGHEDVRSIPNRQGSLNGMGSLRRKMEIVRSGGLPRAVISKLGKPRTHIEGYRADTETLLSFSEQYIVQAPNSFLDARSFQSSAGQFDAVVVGSDQVWHPTYGLAYGLSFLEPWPPDARIAYAASFGVESLPSHVRARYKKGLSGIRRLSVREHRAEAIVAGLTGRRVPVVLDPTMLLNSRDWVSLSDGHHIIEAEGYIMRFVLGDGAFERLDSVEMYARRTGSEIIDFSNVGQLKFAHMSPLAFLEAIRHANLVVTDSFHAAVFCILHRVPVIVQRRGDMGSRFETLFMNCGLKYPQFENRRQLNAAMDIDWDAVHDHLGLQRDASKQFLAEALETS